MWHDTDMQAVTTGVQRALVIDTGRMPGGIAPAMAEGQLNVYNWGDYINPEVLERFSEEFDVEVTLDTYGTNEEMLAKNPPDEVLSELQIFEDLDQELKIYNAEWTRVKTAQ